MRVAAVQLDFLPAYFRSGINYLSYPLVSAVDTGDPKRNEEIIKWREELRTTYCRLFGRKLDRVVRSCIALGADLIVLPEYSVPLECLHVLRALSRRHPDVAIVAGTHRVDATRRLSAQVLPEIGRLALDGRAIAPIFRKGRATIVTKLTCSRYDDDVAGRSISADDRRPLTIAGVSTRIWICSDFLKRPQRRLKTSELQILVCYTPALGDFTAHLSDDSSWADTLRAGYRVQKTTPPGVAILVNNAHRGGTKAFFNNRASDTLDLDAVDGSYGVCAMYGNQIKQCGFPAGTEGAVLLEVEQSGKGLSCRQHGLMPILHCADPTDARARRVIELFAQVRHATTLVAKRQVLRAAIPTVIEGLTDPSTTLLRAKLSHLESHLGDVHSAEHLDRLVCDACIIHEHAPSLSEWRQRSCSASIELLRHIRDASQNGNEIVDARIRDLQQAVVAGISAGRSTLDDAPGEFIAALERPDKLELPSWFRRAVVSNRSGSAASLNGIEFIHHLLAAEEPEQALRYVERLRRDRPYSPFGITDRLDRILRSARPDTHAAREMCEEFLRVREIERDTMRRVCQQAARDLSPPALVFGYSEMVLLLLMAATKRRKFPLVVAECRNRTTNWGGVALARALAKAEFPVTFVSDATVGRRLAAAKRPIRTTLMGFNLAGPGGVINTVGSLSIAALSRHYGAKVVFVGQSFKLLGRARWDLLSPVALEPNYDAVWLGQAARTLLGPVYVENPKSDCVPWRMVDSVVTDAGIATGKGMARRLKALP